MCTVCIAVSGQECTAPDTVGSLDQDRKIIDADQTYILAGYTVQCKGIVTTWEFCYQIHSVTSVTFYPGIWENTSGGGGDTTYSLIQSNTVAFNPTGTSNNNLPCQNYTLPITEQFTAPSGSVVGLYSNTGNERPQLLHTNDSDQITTYRVGGNQSTVGTGSIVNYNIAIRVHLGKLSPTNRHKYMFHVM